MLLPSNKPTQPMGKYSFIVEQEERPGNQEEEDTYVWLLKLHMSFRQTLTRNLYRDSRQVLLLGQYAVSGQKDTMINNFVTTDMRQYGLYNTFLMPSFSLCLLDSNVDKPVSVSEQEGSQHVQ